MTRTMLELAHRATDLQTLSELETSIVEFSNFYTVNAKRTYQSPQIPVS